MVCKVFIFNIVLVEFIFIFYRWGDLYCACEFLYLALLSSNLNIFLSPSLNIFLECLTSKWHPKYIEGPLTQMTLIILLYRTQLHSGLLDAFTNIHTFVPKNLTMTSNFLFPNIRRKQDHLVSLGILRVCIQVDWTLLLAQMHLPPPCQVTNWERRRMRMAVQKRGLIW